MNGKSMLTGVLLGIALALCAGVYWLYSLSRAPTGYARPVEKITIGTVSNETSTLVLIARDRGYFRENGLDVTIKEYQSGNFSVDALLEGEVDVASCSEFALVERIFQKGKNLRYLGSYATVDNHEVIARKDRGIADPVHLRGKKVGVTFTSVASFYLGIFLAFNGLSLDDVELVDVKPLDMKDALADGKVDAVITWEPNVWNIKAEMDGEVTAWPGQSQPYYWLLVSAGEVIEARADAMKRLMMALAGAEGFVKENAEEAKAIVGRICRFDAAYLDHVWGTKTKYALSLDQALLLAMEDEARWMIRNNMSHEHKRIPDYLDYLYPDALYTAKPQSIRLIATEKSGGN